MDYKETYFYKKYKPLLDAFVDAGGNVEDLRKKDRLYVSIKDFDLRDENGNRVDVETKFAILEHERKRVRVKDAKQALIEAVDAYKANGGSFHMPRKELPFYPLLHAYAENSRLKGVEKTYEELMKGLGYTDYSDTYYRCMGLESLKDYRDEQGYVDTYKKNAKMKNYIETLSDYYDIPYFLIIGLLCEEKQKKIVIKVNYIDKVKEDLEKFIEENGNLKGIKTKDIDLYLRLRRVRRFLSDGSGMQLSMVDVLTIMGIEDVKHNFNEEVNQEINIDKEMQEIKNNYDGKMVKLNTIDPNVYRKICKKAVSMGVYVSDLFEMYEMKCNGLNIDRLSRMQMNEIPFIDEMLARKHELIKASGISLKNGNCKEEILERDVKICKQVYEEFKEQLYGFNFDDGIKVD